MVQDQFIKKDHLFDRIAIVGAGKMGSQIGFHCALNGVRVILIDNDNDQLRSSSRYLINETEDWIHDGKLSPDSKDQLVERIEHTSDLRSALFRIGLVIEAIPERLALKREMFEHLDELCDPGVILATNSSSIRISLIEDVTRHPERVLNMHFYRQPWSRPVVELMGGTRTSLDTIQMVARFVKSIHLVPFIVRKESTGFIYNRIWRAIKRECLHLVEEGVASYEEVDRAWMLLTGLPIGPFGLMDDVGLDVVRDIEMIYFIESGNSSDYPPKILIDHIERGDLGVKTGRGFYHYPHPAYEKLDWLRKEDNDQQA
jgi:3-hydroxybutyryl-CoA dehydrogenase